MLVSCFWICGAVCARLESFYRLPAPFPVAIVLMLIGLAIYDAVALKRIHRATVLAFGSVVFAFAVGAILIATGVADATIDLLRPVG